MVLLYKIKNTFFRAFYYFLHLWKSTNKGHRIHSEFIYRFLEQTIYTPCQFYHFENVKKIRALLCKSQEILEIEDFGAGSTIHGKKKYRSVSSICKVSSSPQWKSEQWFRMLNYLKCDSVVELGTNLGLNAFMLSGLGSSVSVYTVEGSSSLAKFAKELIINNNVGNVTVYHAHFNNYLASSVNRSVQAALIDGNHRGEAIKHYIHHFIDEYPNLKIILVDDIYWSADVYSAWKEIFNNPPKPWVCLDAFHYGILIRSPILGGKLSYHISI